MREQFCRDGNECISQQLDESEKASFKKHTGSSGTPDFDVDSYYETFLQPSLLANENPERVALIVDSIVGFAAIKQVLIHASITECLVIVPGNDAIDLDKIRHNVPANSLDCSDLVGRADFCPEDSRVNIVNGDPSAWLTANTKLSFEIIAIDMSNAGSTGALFLDERFVRDAHDKLSDSGMLVVDIGDRDTAQGRSAFVTIWEGLKKDAFEYTRDFSSFVHGFGKPRLFRVAMNSFAFKSRWFLEAPELEIEMAQRLVATHSGASPLASFDGASHAILQFPARTDQELYCRHVARFPCAGWSGFDLEIPHAPGSWFRVAPSLIPNAGRGVFTRNYIQNGTYMALDESVYSMWMLTAPMVLVDMIWEAKREFSSAWAPLLYYSIGYGVSHNLFGMSLSYVVDPGILTFANHGCNGTSNIGFPLTVTELTADPDVVPANDDWMFYYFDSWSDRNMFTLAGSGDRFIKDVPKGGEVLDNYLVIAEPEEWKDNVVKLKEECSSIAVGVVTGYESEK